MRHDTALAKSEQIVVGAMLAAESFAWSMKERGLRPSMFLDQFNQDVVSAVYEIIDEGRKVTLNLVVGRVKAPESGLSAETLIATMVSTAREEDGGALDHADVIREAYRKRRAAEIGRDYMKAVTSPDVDIDAVVSALAEQTNDLVAGGEAKDRRMSSAVDRVRAKAKAAYAKGADVGFHTGLADLDAIIGGIMPGRLFVIGGGPGAGKSALGYQILHKMATERGGALYFQRDMGEGDVVNRALSSLSGLPVRRIEGGLDAFELEQLVEAERRLAGLDIELDTDATTIEDITAIATAKKRNGALSMVLVDHLRKFGTRRKTKDKWEVYSIVTAGLHDLAVKLDVPVVLLSQITRMAQRKDNPIPEMQDLDGGGSLEQDADTVVILFNRNRWILREKLNGERPTDQTERTKHVDAYYATMGKVEAHLSKHRLGAPDQKCELRFVGRTSSFADA